MLPTVEQSNSLRKETNAITQSMPSNMVVPSDALLKRMGCLKEEKKQERKYKKYDARESKVNSLLNKITQTEKLLK